MLLDFLSSDVPLVKRFAMHGTQIEAHPYPMVRNFTSHRVDAANLNAVFAALNTAATQGWCLLKGLLSRPIKSESRAGLTNPADATQLLVLDFDGLREPATLDEALDRLGLLDYQRIIQWSASSHVYSGRGLSCHVFFWLAHPVSPQLVKHWLQREVMSHFMSGITLTKAGAALHWPVDPSVMDNGKLIYVAPPVLQGLKSLISGSGIELNATGLHDVPTSFFAVNPQEVSHQRNELLNELRKKSGMRAISQNQYKASSGQSYLSRPGVAIVTGRKIERGFIYLNLNGGDSWGYWHPEDNASFIYNFKGEPVYKTSELLPDYWDSLQGVEPEAAKRKTTYFVCRDFRTDKLYNGMYDSVSEELTLAQASNESRLRSFLRQYNLPDPEFIPDFTIDYAPSNPLHFSLEDRYINTFTPSPLMGQKRRKITAIPPVTTKIISSAVGEGEIFDHFINWLAVIIQKRIKTGTAWVLHGNEGTGKGVLFFNVIKPLVGENNAMSVGMRELDSPFNGWAERALVVFADEVQMSGSKQMELLTAATRILITEPVVPIRRMYTNPYSTPSYTNLIFASNMPDPVVIPQSDRRFNVGAFQPKRLMLTNDEIKALGDEVADFHEFLMHYAADEDRARTVLATEERDRLKDLSLTAADSMTKALIAGDMEDLVDNMPQRALLPHEMAYDSLVRELLATGEEKITRDELLVIFRYRVGTVPESPNKFTSFLRHHGIHTKRVRRGERRFYGVEITWKQDAAWRAQRLSSLTSSASDSSNVVPMKARL